VEGIIVSFLDNKGYGFIDGNDGKKYFFLRSWISVSPIDGMMVTFEGEPSPKGYNAKNIKPIEKRPSFNLYKLPSEFIVSKGSNPIGYEIIDYPNWYVCSHTTKSNETADDARHEIIQYAKRLGANALINLSYSKGTGSEAGTGRGTHYYTTHHFTGIPVIIGKKHANGVSVNKVLNQNAANIKKELLDMNEASKRKSMIFRVVVLLTGLGLGAYTTKHELWIIIAVVCGILLYTSSPKKYDWWLNEFSSK
jgi:cold shock CspA family protein